MAMRMVLEGVKACGGSVWLAELAPQEVRQRLGEPRHTQGRPSVVLLAGLQFDAGPRRLEFDPSGVVVLNLGTTTDVVLVDTRDPGSVAMTGAPAVAAEPAPALGPGDQAFLTMVRRDAPRLLPTARGLVSGVRALFPGDLVRGRRRSFVEGPDNFWAVDIQPRAGNFQVHVRGKPERFTGSPLKLMKDRGSYTRFYVRDPAEADAAVGLIAQAPRKARSAGNRWSDL